jgi:hypothetical protein
MFVPELLLSRNKFYIINENHQRKFTTKIFREFFPHQTYQKTMYTIVIGCPSTVSVYHAYDHIIARKGPDKVSSTVYHYYSEVMLTTTRELDTS